MGGAWGGIPRILDIGYGISISHSLSLPLSLSLSIYIYTYYVYMYTYIYVYIYWRLGGKKRQLIPIEKSVSVSFRVRVVHACMRAKLCGCVRQVSPTLGARMERLAPTPPARVLPFHFVVLYAWVLKEIH